MALLLGRGDGAFDFSIRTKLAIWAGLGVLLVAGMLAEQQYRRSLAARNATPPITSNSPPSKRCAPPIDLRSMQIEMREIRLAIAPSEVDRALERLRADSKQRRQRIEQPRSNSPTTQRTRAARAARRDCCRKLCRRRRQSSRPPPRTTATPSSKVAARRRARPRDERADRQINRSID